MALKNSNQALRVQLDRLFDESGIASIFDEGGNIYRLAISGKVQIASPQAPSGTNEIVIDAGNPLELSGSTYTTNYIISSGTTFYVQQISAGAEGDPAERGSKIEVFFNDGTDHIIERIYLNRESIFGIFPDTNKARDGTSLSGNGVNKLKIKRTILQGNSNREIDVVLRGFETS